ncbi:helix-turn-helix transcriptional regulator [Xanthomarina gelatinilytica]|uniref:helix-turn-helix transcriptional regulator n=1 Tax=Xanthomarina gelatinilytica TaxID=1137281 RepID=UPI003AA9C3AD
MSIKERAHLTVKRFLRLKEVKDITGLSRSTIYEFMRKGDFPRNVSLGANSTAWISTEIDQWVNDRIAQRDGEAA